MRFLHLADVHLDTPFGSRTDELRQRLRDASREALRRAFRCAMEEEVDVVLLAGDLFDGQHLSFATERFLVTQLGELTAAGIGVIYATGNHDPGRGGLRAHGLEWPDGVVVVGEREARRLPVRRGDRVVGWVTAAGHASERETMDLSRAFPRPLGELPEVGLLHTQVVAARGSGPHDPYAPSELDHLRRAGFDYWALGHIHVRQSLSESPPIHYPGNLMGRSPRESGAKGGLLVDLTDRNAPSVMFRPFTPVRWETIRVDGLEAADTLDRLVGRVRAVWDRFLRDDAHGVGRVTTEWMIRVVLEGATPLWRELAHRDELRTVADEIAHALSALDVLVEAPSIHPVLAVEEHRARKDVLGEALRLLADVREGRARLDDVEPGDLAGLEMDGSLDVDGYVRSLLEGAEGELLVRLLHGGGR